MNPGKKYYVIPRDTYELMMDKKQTHHKPERNELIRSEQKMKDVWSSNMSPHEKVKHFTDELSKFTTYMNALNQPLNIEIKPTEGES